ncbi:hypothetical protein DSO57_1004221 [Entomophthora muscae]|uniref:Uncharacterized protein n=1 Tax=Entomophthora muscae TaxID=34485 RepID=A0ACC2RN24_9FUNG|nr:hypothetical protein DSO57_1004221 [Entomophthora muscae]
MHILENVPGRAQDILTTSENIVRSLTCNNLKFSALDPVLSMTPSLTPLSSPPSEIPAPQVPEEDSGGQKLGPKRAPWLLGGMLLMGLDSYFPCLSATSSLWTPLQAPIPVLHWMMSWWVLPPGCEPNLVSLAPLSHSFGLRLSPGVLTLRNCENKKGKTSVYWDVWQWCKVLDPPRVLGSLGIGPRPQVGTCCWESQELCRESLACLVLSLGFSLVLVVLCGSGTEISIVWLAVIPVSVSIGTCRFMVCVAAVVPRGWSIGMLSWVRVFGPLLLSSLRLVECVGRLFSFLCLSIQTLKIGHLVQVYVPHYMQLESVVVHEVGS